MPVEYAYICHRLLGDPTAMLAKILAIAVGSGSFILFMAAFFFPEVYRKGDFIWSGVGIFYAIVLWFCAGQATGAELLGEAASVTLIWSLGTQLLVLRRQKTPTEQQTPTETIGTAPKKGGFFGFGAKAKPTATADSSAPATATAGIATSAPQPTTPEASPLEATEPAAADVLDVSTDTPADIAVDASDETLTPPLTAAEPTPNSDAEQAESPEEDSAVTPIVESAVEETPTIADNQSVSETDSPDDLPEPTSDADSGEAEADVTEEKAEAETTPNADHEAGAELSTEGEISELEPTIDPNSEAVTEPTKTAPSGGIFGSIGAFFGRTANSAEVATKAPETTSEDDVDPLEDWDEVEDLEDSEDVEDSEDSTEIEANTGETGDSVTDADESPHSEAESAAASPADSDRAAEGEPEAETIEEEASSSDEPHSETDHTAIKSENPDAQPETTDEPKS